MHNVEWLISTFGKFFNGDRVTVQNMKSYPVTF